MRDAGSLLVRAGLIDADALAQARADRARDGGTLAEHLVLSGVIEDDELTQFFRERLMVPRVSSERLRAVPKRIITRIPAELAGELRVVPVALDSESSLTIAMSDPSDTHALDELEFFTEHYVVRAVASQAHIAWCLDHYYGVATPLLVTDKVDSGPVSLDFEGESTAPFSLEAGGPPRPRRVSEAVNAARRRAVVPETGAPMIAKDPDLLEATLEDLEATEQVGFGDHTDVDLGEPSYELVLDDDDLEEVEPDDPDTAEHPLLELDADEPDSNVRTKVLEDGSPGELAPRVGEVLVNLPSDLRVGGGPAVVLDDSLFVAPKTAAAARHEPVSEDEEETRQVIRIEADEPEPPAPNAPQAGKGAKKGAKQLDNGEVSDGVVRSEMERGTDSAPILLSEIKAAVIKAERASRISELVGSGDLEEAGTDEEPTEPTEPLPELEIEAVEQDSVDEDQVVLLEMPKRKRRSTALGVGAPTARAAHVLGLRTGKESSDGADAVAADAPEGKNVLNPPVIVDDQDQQGTLPELEAWEPNPSPAVKPRAKRPSSMTGMEAAAVAELDAGWGSVPDEDEGGDRERVLDTLEALARADHRDHIVAAVLDYLDHYCDRVVFLALKSGALEAFQIRSSEPIDAPKAARLPLREVSLLRDIVDTRLPYRGPLEDEPSQKLLLAVFGELSTDGLAVPVAVRGRVVGLLYGDGISPDLSGDNVGLVTQAAGRALERTLRQT